MPKAKLPASVTEPNRLSIVYKKLSEIKLLPDSTNPKKHAEAEIIASIKAFGMIDPIAINGTTANDFDGNGRAKILAKMRDAGEPCPLYCYESEDKTEWFVPTVDGVKMDVLTESRAALALNRSNQLGVYDEIKLAALLENINENGGETALAGTGYSTEDLNALLMKAAAAKPTGNNGNAGGNNAGNAPEGNNGSAFAASHVRMKQLFLNAETEPVFTARIDALIRTGKFIFDGKPADNLTDLVFAVIEAEAERQNIKIETETK